MPKQPTTKTATTKTATTKTATTKTATTKTETPIKTETLIVDSAAPIVDKKTKAKKVAVEATPTIESATTTEVVEPTVDDPTVDDPVSTVITQSLEFLAKLNQLTSFVASIKSDYRALEKKMARELKVAQKNGKKGKRKTGNRAPSGFVKPTPISNELASFLEKPYGTEMARTDVTREINKYIRAHDLQDKSNGRKINPDNKLTSLLKLKVTDELTYFNLQRYMSVHFQKSAAAIAAAAATIPASTA
jgi:chromatin remodeling complex protein RSC6